MNTNAFRSLSRTHRPFALLLSTIGLACSGSELDDCRTREATALDSLRSAQSELDALRAENRRLNDTPDSMWMEIARVEPSSTDPAALKLIERFLRAAPEHPRHADAKALADSIRIRIADAVKQAEMASSRANGIAATSGIRVQQLVTSPADFAGKIFQRLACCTDVSLSQYTTKTGIHELNANAFQMYNTKCYWMWRYEKQSYGDGYSGGPDFSSAIEVRLSPEQAKIIGSHAPSKIDREHCPHQLSAEFEFRGQISNSRPVFYVESMKVLDHKL